MKKLAIFLFFVSILTPQYSFAVTATNTRTEVHTKQVDKKAVAKKNGGFAAIIGGVLMVVGFVLSVPMLKIAFLGTAVIMFIIAIVYFIKSMR